MKRRNFIRDVSILGPGLAITGCASQNLVKTPSSSKSINKTNLGIALVGLGDYSKDQLGPALQRTKLCHLAGIVTGSPDKIPEWQEKYAIKDSNIYNYGNMNNIGDNDEIDVIYIVLPTSLHAEYAIKAAEAGKHVWCEKPMAMTAKECQSVIDACNKNGVRLSIGYRMMHETNTLELISYRDSKPFGEITGITAEACYSGGKPSTWRGIKSMGGGAMYDMGVYTVSGIRYATGLEPIEVLSAKHIIDRPELFTEVDETTVYELLLSNGVRAMGMASVGKRNNILQVDCESGWYNVSPMQSYYGVSGERSDGHKLDAAIYCQQCLQMDNDAASIMGQKPVMCPGEMGKRDIEIIEGIFKSAATGLPVDISIS